MARRRREPPLKVPARSAGSGKIVMGQGIRAPAARRIGRFFGVRRSGATKSVGRNGAGEVVREGERMQMRENGGLTCSPVIISLSL